MRSGKAVKIQEEKREGEGKGREGREGRGERRGEGRGEGTYNRD